MHGDLEHKLRQLGARKTCLARLSKVCNTVKPSVQRGLTYRSRRPRALALTLAELLLSYCGRRRLVTQSRSRRTPHYAPLRAARRIAP